MTFDFYSGLLAAEALDEETWALFQLGLDPLRHKLPSREKRRLTTAVLTSVRELANSLRAEYGELTPSVIATAKRLRIVKSLVRTGARVLFSSYDEDTNSITLNTDLFQRVTEWLEIYGLSAWTNGSQFEEIAVAHELYHHLEAVNSSLITVHYRVTLWSLGPFSYNSRISSLSEIGAFYFAKLLCGLAVNPMAFGLIALYETKPSEADILLSQLYSYRQ